MKIIDVHMHFSSIESFRKTAVDISGVEYSSAGLTSEYCKAGIIMGIGMGLAENSPGSFPDLDANNPMGLDLENTVPPFIACCPGINPVILAKNTAAGLSALKRELENPKTVGIKLYPGYYPYHVHDEIYEPVCHLAAEYDVPVVIHCGVTYSDRGLLKYSKPLEVDELAVRHPELRLVVCHMGDPWVMDTAALLSKNANVYTDLSGLMVLNKEEIERRSLNADVMGHFRRALAFEERYDRFLFGTDWPLAPAGAYVAFVSSLIPGEYREMVFYSNALRVFPRLADLKKFALEV